jgi:hypothetical protein
MQQKDALTVLLTGRSEAGFTNIIKRMVASRKLDFDLICLKPEVGPNSQRFSRTLDFKHTFLEDLILTYKNAEEIRVYEDRSKQYDRLFSFFWPQRLTDGVQRERIPRVLRKAEQDAFGGRPFSS